jgi:hypothetical protein
VKGGALDFLEVYVIERWDGPPIFGTPRNVQPFDYRDIDPGTPSRVGSPRQPTARSPR